MREYWYSQKIHRTRRSWSIFAHRTASRPFHQTNSWAANRIPKIGARKYTHK